MKKLIIYGIGAQAELAYAYFEKDSEYKVVAFTIEKAYLKETQFFELPVYPFEEIEKIISPDEADMYIAIGPIKVFSLLEKFFHLAKDKGYNLASYCPSIIKVYFEPVYGKNCLFDHGSMFHPFVKLGNGVTINNSQVGHHSEIGNFSFLSSAILAGNVFVEDYVYIGMRTIIKDNIRIGKGSIIGMGCIITKDVAPYSVYSTPGTKPRDGMDSRDIDLFKTR